MEYLIVNGELYHYGLKGMTWGTRRWQYEDGRFNEAGKERYFGQSSSHRPPSVVDNSSGSHSYRGTGSQNRSDIRSNKQEKKSNKDSNSKSKKESKANSVLKSQGSKKVSDIGSDTRNIKEDLNTTKDELDTIKKWALITGISLATAAGVVAAGYYINSRSSGSINQILKNGYNLDPSLKNKAVGLTSRLFDNPLNGSYVGSKADFHGYNWIDADDLRSSLKNRKVGIRSFDQLVKNVRKNQLSSDGKRRLSCWSASLSYYFSGLTGGDYVSKSFSNLVDFNDFGKLYNEMPEIFTAYGQKASDFVGKFGRIEPPGGRKTAKALIKNILTNVNSSNNLTADGKSTIGFINAAYHRTTCTHQFNFDITEMNGVKKLFIADGYTGERYVVGNLLKSGNIRYETEGLRHLAKELREYNPSSIRFYAPKLESLNLEMLSECILGRI